MTEQEFADERSARLMRMAAERTSGDFPTMLSMPVGARMSARGVRKSDLDEMRRMSGGISVSDVSVDPTYHRMKVWHYMFGVPYSPGRASTVTMRSLPQFQKRNADWDGILSGLNRVGRPSGEGEFLRPEGEWIYDLASMDGGYRLMEAAHVVAHARAIVARTPVREMRFRGFLETLSELVIAMRYGLTVWVPSKDEIVSGKRSGAMSGFEESGIRPVVSVSPRRPWLVAGMANGCLELFSDSAAVLVGIHLEPQPWSSREGNPDPKDRSWLEMNRWSCMPSVVALCGWVGLDELSKAPSVSRTPGQDVSTGSFVMPVTALDGPSTLDMLMCGRREPSDPGRGRWTVGDLLSSTWLESLSMIVSPLPCRDCLRLNMASEGAPSRPAHRRPDPKDRRPDPEAVREWAEYDAKVDRIVETVRSACDFYDRRFLHPGGGVRLLRERRRNARFVDEAIRRMGTNSRRAASLRTKGFSDRAAELDRKSEDLVNKMEGMLNGLH